MDLHQVRAALDRHERIALCASGGKDSTAVAYLLRPFLDRITLYHMDAGDLLPEITTVVRQLQSFAPNFVAIQGDIEAAVARDGLPTDLLPHSAHPVGQLMGEGVKLVGRYDCCWANLMAPLHQRIVADGNTLLIRGTKAVDMHVLPARSGDVIDGLELLYPIETWSHAEVLAYLREVGAPIARVYDHVTNAPECARCSAWWSEGRNAYLRRYHPRLWVDYRARLEVVADAVAAPLAHLRREATCTVDACAPPAERLDWASAQLWSLGHRVLQGSRLAPTEAGHVAELLALMRPLAGARIVDVGAGFGEVARLMRELRPDLDFVLINNSAAQLARAPPDLTTVVADMHAMPLPAASMDGAMFCYSLCHADPFLALAEARRVVRPGGFAFIYDYERVAGDDALLEQHLFARAHTHDDLAALAQAAGWANVVQALPDPGTCDDQVFRDVFGDDALYDQIFNDLRPAIWRLERA